MAEIIKLTEENFEQAVLLAPGKVLVDFWAEWCGPCRMLGPVLEKLNAEGIEGLSIGKVNVDDQYKLAMKYEVSSIPALKLFAGGQVVAEQVGAVPLPALKKLVGAE